MKTLIRLSAISLLVIIVVTGCQKEYSEQNLPGLQVEFTPASVKQWYSDSFRKTSEWKNAWSHAKKLPGWKNGIYHKSAGFEFLEFPLLKQKSRFLVPFDSSLTNSQITKVVGASLSRVIFIRDPHDAIFVREVDYVPDWQYLQKRGFDISKTCYGEPGNDFTGVMIIKDWAEAQIQVGPEHLLTCTIIQILFRLLPEICMG